MLIGEFTHSIDEKNRVALPAKFRAELGKRVVITYGLDQCLALYPAGEWGKISEKLTGLSTGQADSRGFNRLMLSGASDADIDSSGRLLIPEHLKQFAKLAGKMVFTGVGNRLELWNEARWASYKKSVTSRADALAQKLGEIGAF
jgi:MraZ protein